MGPMPGMGWPALAAAVALRWLALSALAALIGALALDLLVLPRGDPEAAPARAALGRLGAAVAAALLLATAGELVTRAETMAGGGLGAGLAVVPVVLARTHFGAIWIGRAVALVLVLVLAAADAWRGRPATLVLAAGVAASTALTGHAADRGDLSLAALVDWGHIVAASAWTGGLFALALVLRGAGAHWSPPLFAAVARRFSSLATACLLVVLATGVYNAWLQLGGISPLWMTAYGRVLAAKLALVLVIALLGAVNRFLVVPRLSGGGARGAGGPARLRANVACEAVLALAVFACTAVLGHSEPARPARAAGGGHDGAPAASAHR